MSSETFPTKKFNTCREYKDLKEFYKCKKAKDLYKYIYIYIYIYICVILVLRNTGLTLNLINCV